MSASDTGSGAAVVTPLTKKKKDTRELYRRRAEVEEQLGRVIGLSGPEIAAALAVRGREQQGYLLDETLVHLLRRAWRAGDREMIEQVYAELDRRMWRLLGRFRNYFREPADIEDLGQKVGEVFLRKLSSDGDLADYAEVNFGDFILTEAKTACKGQLVRLRREQNTISGDDEDERGGTRLDRIGSGEPTAEYKALLKDEIAKLPAKTRLVAALLADGWKIESTDESEPTVARQLGVTSRTIRNWLKEAREMLAGVEGELR